MKENTTLRTTLIGALCLTGALLATAAKPADQTTGNNIPAGTWSLVAADVIRPDGSRARDYGAAPSGSLMIDSQGRYSLQIFKAERPRFLSGNKLTGTPAEFEAAVLGSSTHFGTVSVDQAEKTITFSVQGASFPNWEGERQTRRYELKGDELSYRLAARPDGNVPISVWKRMSR
jgi:hypothetical protein